MSAQVFSAQWWRVAPLRPRLAPQVRVRRQLTRGERWMVLADELTGRSVRLNPAAYAVAGRMNGRHSMEQLWARAQQAHDDPPTQDELVDVLMTLHEAALLEFEATDGAPALDGAWAARAASGPGEPGPAGAPARRPFNPLAWRIPLGHPGAWLDRLSGVQRLAFSAPAAGLWLAMVLLLVVLGAWHRAELWAHGATWLQTPRFAWLAVVLYPPIKAVHELAHGLAVRRWGGTVREAGVTLMMGLPVPYVDASAAAAFPRARERMVVSAAGIAVELAIASVSLLAWLALDEGWARDTAFVALAITTVSTLMFNANPLQRMDGYPLLCDALGLPNLGPRSRAWWMQALQRRLLDAPDGDAMPLAPGERPWLVAYAPLSWAWTLGTAALGVAWLSSLSWVLGTAAAGMVAVGLVGRPAWTIVRTLSRAARAQSHAARRWRRWSLGAAAAAVALLGVPVPQRLVAQGVVWPPEQAQLRAGSGGVVMAVHRADGDLVQAGDGVLSLGNADLWAAAAQADARVQALETEALQAAGAAQAPDGSERAANVLAQLEAARAEARQGHARLDELEVRAQSSGRVALPPAADLDGHYLKEGSLVGQVLTGEAPVVRVAVPADRASELRSGDRGAVGRAVSVRLADDRARPRDGHVVRDSQGAVPQLPGAALAERHGGEWPTDPADPEGLRPLKPVVLVDVAVDPAAAADPGEATPQRLGARAWVRFDLGWSPLAWQGAQALRRAWLRHVNPQH